jgi:hypothetical protein
MANCKTRARWSFTGGLGGAASKVPQGRLSFAGEGGGGAVVQNC